MKHLLQEVHDKQDAALSEIERTEVVGSVDYKGVLDVWVFYMNPRKLTPEEVLRIVQKLVELCEADSVF